MGHYIRQIISFVCLSSPIIIRRMVGRNLIMSNTKKKKVYRQNYITVSAATDVSKKHGTNEWRM